MSSLLDLVITEMRSTGIPDGVHWYLRQYMQCLLSLALSEEAVYCMPENIEIATFFRSRLPSDMLGRILLAYTMVGLDISFTVYTAEELKQILSACPQLEYLNLSASLNKVEGCKVLGMIADLLPKLVSLDFNFMRWLDSWVIMNDVPWKKLNHFKVLSIIDSIYDLKHISIINEFQQHSQPTIAFIFNQ